MTPTDASAWRSLVSIGVAFACAVVAAGRWLVAWRRGDERVRDRRGRLKPAAAAALALAIVVALGTVASVATS